MLLAIAVHALAEPVPSCTAPRLKFISSFAFNKNEVI